jgi:hypothetical protein
VYIYGVLMKDRIKVGMLLESTTIPAWQYHLFEQLLMSNHTSIELLIFGYSRRSAGKAARRESFLYKAFKRHQERKPGFSGDACENRNVEDLIQAIDQISLPDQSVNGQPGANLMALEKLKPYRLDAVIALGCFSRIGTLYKATRFGVWFFQHSYRHTNCSTGSSVGVWDVIKRRPFIYSALMIRQADTQPDRIAYESYSGISHLSHIGSRNAHLWKMLFFVPRTLQRLHRIGGEQFWQQLNATASNRSDAQFNHDLPLTNPKLFMPLLSYAAWRLKLKIERRFHTERWILMSTRGGEYSDLASYKRIDPPKGRFWADPYVLRRDGAYYIFFEDASIKTGRGHISLIKMNDNGDYTAPTPILERPYHLSYPFIFEWEKGLYLIPESAEVRTVEVYHCRKFPYEWEHHSNLMENISAYDATLLEHNGLWWLFANVQEHADASSWDELCLFYSDSPLSKRWQPHPMNPVISDVRYARPAGRIYTEDGRLYRPSQDSSYRYGYGLNINEIEELTETTYREKNVISLQPTWDKSIRALHTISKAEELVVIDAIHRSRKRAAAGD